MPYDIEDLAIIHYPDPRLRKKCAPITEFNGDLGALAERMNELMHDGKGVGAHAHPEHLIIYYPFSHSAALKVVELNGQAIQYKPVQNTAVYLVPGTLHEVEKNATSQARISLALRWATAAS